MKLIVPLIGVLFLTGCELAHTMMEQPYDREKRPKPDQPAGQPNVQAKPKSSALLQNNSEIFTGKVVLDNGAYRLQLSDGTLMRLTRGRRETEFETQQILLRKYYEKTITVKGTRQDDWIWHADITGQYVQPGGPTGPNMNAPKQTRP